MYEHLQAPLESLPMHDHAQALLKPVSTYDHLQLPSVFGPMPNNLRSKKTEAKLVG